MKRYIDKNYTPKGQLKDLPDKVINALVYNQCNHNINKIDIKLLEQNIVSAFTWVNTIEGYDFWQKVIIFKDYNLILQNKFYDIDYESDKTVEEKTDNSSDKLNFNIKFILQSKKKQLVKSISYCSNYLYQKFNFILGEPEGGILISEAPLQSFYLEHFYEIDSDILDVTANRIFAIAEKYLNRDIGKHLDEVNFKLTKDGLSIGFQMLEIAKCFDKYKKSYNNYIDYPAAIEFNFE